VSALHLVQRMQSGLHGPPQPVLLG
jgi:hypothetical protein